MKPKMLSVSQMNDYIKGVFDDEIILHDVIIYGEIFEFNKAGSNTYITLREDNSTISCLHFGSMENYPIGAKVKLYGSINFSQKSGKLSFIFKSLTPYGAGELYAEFLKLKEKLKLEGVFDNKRIMPNFVKKVAIITSETGAVIHDFVSTFFARDFGSVVIFPVRVQGDNASAEIVSAIQNANSAPGFDVIVIARGGGSNSDLACFNTEAVARAVSGSLLPVVSAVGHETDYTLCDFSSTLRAGTPSIAGEILAAINERVFERFASVKSRLVDNFDALMQNKENKLLGAANKVAQNANLKMSLSQTRLSYLVKALNSSVNMRFDRAAQRVRENAKNMCVLADAIIARKEGNIEKSEALLDKNSPLRILSKGYSKVFYKNKLVTSVDDIELNESVDIFFKDGRARAITQDKQKILIQAECEVEK